MTTSFPDLPDVPDSDVPMPAGEGDDVGAADPTGIDVPSDLPDGDAEMDSTAQGPIDPEQSLPG